MKKIEKEKIARHMFTGLLKGPIAYHSLLAKASGSPNLAIFWSQIFYWSDKGFDPEGWIHKTSEEMYEETGLTRRMQETARREGKKLGILLEKRAGSPARMHYKISEDHTIKLVSDYVQSVEKASVVKEDDKPFVFDQEVEKLENNEKRRDMNIIGLYMRERKASLSKTLTNRKTFQVALRRHLKPAGQLIDFTDDQILDGVDKAKKSTKDSKVTWTLETVLKELTK